MSDLARRILGSSSLPRSSPPIPRLPPVVVPLDLVEWLESVYPDRLPPAVPGETREDRFSRIDRLAGAVEVVRFLRDRAARPQPTPSGEVSA